MLKKKFKKTVSKKIKRYKKKINKILNKKSKVRQ